jgi:hypothetical protein
MVGMVRSSKRWALVVLIGVTVPMLDCAPPPADEIAAESNIIRVNKFFNADPWLSFKNDGTGKIDGIRITVYLEGAGRPKGVFGDGTLLVEMYRLDRDRRGQEEATLVHKWELPPERAYAWRAKKETGMGWGYGLRLPWPDDLEVEGRQIAFVVKYVRADGGVISSSRQVVKVPSRQAAPVSMTYGRPGSAH